MTNSEQDAREHIKKVQGHLLDVAIDLRHRSMIHDASKLQEPELSGYAGLSEALKGLTYGTPEHRAAFAPFKEIIQHHYEHNSHHPEHFPNGVEGMSLIDIIEMLCDWKAASERNDGDFAQSLQVSMQRFGIDHQLQRILINTAIHMMWIKEPPVTGKAIE